MTENATILDHIGNTPLLKLSHVSDVPGVDPSNAVILVKGPGGYRLVP